MRKTAIKFGPCYNAVGTSRPSQISYCERVAEKALLSIDQRDFRSIKLGSDKGGKTVFIVCGSWHFTAPSKRGSWTAELVLNG